MSSLFFKQLISIHRGTQRLFSVKYLFGETNIAWNFLLLEYGKEFLDGASFQKLHDFRQAEECYESSIKVFEEMRLLLQGKDEWKISFRDQLNTYSNLWIVQLRQSKTKEGLLNFNG